MQNEPSDKMQREVVLVRDEHLNLLYYPLGLDMCLIADELFLRQKKLRTQGDSE